MTEVASLPDPAVRRAYGPGRVIDLVVTILLLLGNPVAFVFMALGWVLFEFGGADSPNDTGAAQSLTYVAFLVALLVAMAGTIVAIILLVKRHYAWWVALLALVIVCGAGFGALYNWSSVIG